MDYTKNCDITSAFLYALVPEHITINDEIPDTHANYKDRDFHLIGISCNLYGLREAPQLRRRNLVVCSVLDSSHLN